MKRSWRRLFYAALVLLWLGVGGFALEVYERTQCRSRERAAEAYGRQRMAEARADAAAHGISLPVLPAIPPSKQEALEFLSLEDKARSAYAVDKHKWAVTCDPQGTVRASYVPGDPKEIVALAAKVSVGTPVTAILGPVETQDALNAIQAALSGNTHQTRDYPVTLPDGSPYVCEFYFLPVTLNAGEVAVFIQPSTWEVLWKKFRKNVYRTDPYEFRTNNAGFRDREVAMPKPPGLFRILCIGGSTTAEGETNDLTYPAFLDRKLREHFPPNSVEAINCGIFALHSFGELERFPDYLALEPDVIVHYNFVNDLTYDLPNWLKPANPITDFPKAVKMLLRNSRFIYRHFNRWLLPSDAELGRRIDDTTIARLRKMIADARKAGVEMAVCSFAHPEAERLNRPDRDFFDYRINTMFWGRTVDIESYGRVVDLYNAKVRELCAAESILYIPVAENLNGGTEYFSDICHMHPVGIQRKADIIFESLRDRIAPRNTPASR